MHLVLTSDSDVVKVIAPSDLSQGYRQNNHEIEISLTGYHDRYLFITDPIACPRG